MTGDVEGSYSRRAAEYIEQLGSMSTVHPSDVQLVTTWAEGVDGPVLDAGCGPGQWTAHLAGRGVAARGVDAVGAFVDHARASYPSVPFAIGSIDALTDPADSYGGVLAWYSLIHHEPAALGGALGEFARVLRPGGRLLVGFFVGDEVEAFDHAVVTAYRWSVDALTAELEEARFDVVETHTRTGGRPGSVPRRGSGSGPRPHGAILAELRRHP